MSNITNDQTTKIYLIVDNIRSANNVGSLLRTAEGIGVKEVFLCGFTPYPLAKDDERPPYLAQKIDRRINKTALGASVSQEWRYFNNSSKPINFLREHNVEIIGLEQSVNSKPLTEYSPRDSIGLIIGNEVTGISTSTLSLCDQILEIPMAGEKESFNVSIAAAMALFYFRYMV